MKEITEVINKTENRFISVADPGMNYESEKGFAIQILSNNPYLMKIATEHQASLAQAIVNVASINLSLNPAEKQAYLISRTVKENNKYVGKIFLEPSYMGLCKIATDSGSIKWVQADCVYSNDTFLDKGPGIRPEHIYEAFSKNRGDFVGVYCLAKLPDGDFLTTLMDAEEILGIMERSEAVKAHRKNKGSGGPWVSDFKEMAKKTVVRNAFKMWPKTDSNRMANAVNISNENEGFEPLVSSPDTGTFTPQQKGYFDQLIESSDALGMYVFSESFSLNDASGSGATLWISLCHSFPKGQKGKYQTMVNDLRSRGNLMFSEYLTDIEKNIGVDDLAIHEITDELSNDAQNLIASKLNPEMQMEFQKILNT